MTSPGSCVVARRLFVAGSQSWMVSPADGEVRGPCLASGLSASSKLRREDQSEARERFSTVGQF